MRSATLEKFTGTIKQGAELEAKRSSERERKARLRDRRKRRVICAEGVEVSEAEIDLLIQTEWLIEADAADALAIGRAVTALLADTARREKTRARVDTSSTRGVAGSPGRKSLRYRP